MSLNDAGDGLRVRPYAITGGRTRAATEVPIEAIVYRTPKGEKAQHAMALERGQVLQILSTPQSAAEVSARLRLPLGVARVVLGDLVDEGYLALNTRSASGRPDLRLLERVLDGLQAL
ncbi:MAG: DUF742 domain-containing protein [Acidimicrobiales bacterium]|nr:DUF742 domain-containing protein [Acidimicrobiales bacterium]HRW36703.1 DUF742 domain-containing protein [Aquihabitans sp.]